MARQMLMEPEAMTCRLVGVCKRESILISHDNGNWSPYHTLKRQIKCACGILSHEHDTTNAGNVAVHALRYCH